MRTHCGTRLAFWLPNQSPAMVAIRLPSDSAMQTLLGSQISHAQNVRIGGVTAVSSSVPFAKLIAKNSGSLRLASECNFNASRKNVALGRKFNPNHLTCELARGDERLVSAASVGAAEVDTTGAVESSTRKLKFSRPCVILPGLGNNTGDYDALVSNLQARNVSATVVQVARADWLRNAAGLLDGNYWKGTLSPRPVLDWYLERLNTAIEVAKAGATGDGRVSLIGHSAGGWLARVYMAEFGIDDIGLLLTLGTPHLPPPRGVPGVFDQTRGLLYHVENKCPGAYHAPDVKYVCIAGRYLKGSPFGAEQTTPVASTGVGTLDLGEVAAKNAEIASNPEQAAVIVQEASPTFRERFVGAGYKQVCGRADVWGDGVVPEQSAYLEGALNIFFDGVYHSPVGSSSERPWYGTVEILDKWVHHLFDHE